MCFEFQIPLLYNTVAKRDFLKWYANVRSLLFINSTLVHVLQLYTYPNLRRRLDALRKGFIVARKTSNLSDLRVIKL